MGQAAAQAALSSLPGGSGTVGLFEYDAVKGRPVQTFELVACQGERPLPACFADTVRLEVDSNHGHPEWTCLYRLRVHGKPLEV